MKLEIDIDPKDIKSAIERNVRLAVAEKCTSYMGTDYIKKEVSKAFSDTVKQIVSDAMGNSEVIRQKVEQAIEAKLKAQISALMRDKK